MRATTWMSLRPLDKKQLLSLEAAIPRILLKVKPMSYKKSAVSCVQ